MVNPDFHAFCCHITFEKTLMAPGEHQRVPEWHVDGFQGVRAPRHRAEHSYLWADLQAAEFCIQPFFVSHLDPARHNIHDALVEQAREANTLAGFDGHVYLMDPYVVHRTPAVRKGGWRSFVRITFAETELEDPANTVNLALGGGQDYIPRIDARDRLSPWRGDVPWPMYGVRPAMP